MFETDQELKALQDLLDSSIATGGPHLLSTIDETRRPSAEEICDRMHGMCLVTVATVTADGRPITGPFDAYLLHGSLWFSSAWESVRIRHLKARPALSATYLPSADFALWVHGQAEIHDIGGAACDELRQAMIDHYVPIQGPSFAEWVAELDACGVRIDASKVVAFRDW